MASSTELAKWIGDLDHLLLAIQSEKPLAKTTARKLNEHVSQAQLNMQVLRVCISLDRPPEELIDAARSTNVELRKADQLSAQSRSSPNSRAAVRLALGLSSLIVKALAQAPG